MAGAYCYRLIGHGQVENANHCSQNGVPAKALALFFVSLLDQRHGPPALEVANRCNDRVDEGHGSHVGRAKRRRLDRGNKTLIGRPCQRRDKGIGDGDGECAVALGGLQPLHGLPQSAPETYANYEVFAANSTNHMADPACGGSRKDRQADHGEMVLKVMHQRSRGIATQQENLGRFVQSLGQGANLVGIQAIVKRVQVLHVALQGGADQSGWARALALCRFHGVERSGVGNGKIVQVPLKVFVGRKPKPLDDPNGRGGIRTQPVRQGPHTQQDIRPRIFQHRANDLLALGTQMFEFVRQTSV